MSLFVLLVLSSLIFEENLAVDNENFFLPELHNFYKITFKFFSAFSSKKMHIIYKDLNGVVGWGRGWT
jgi:hypothetical protein